MERASTGPERLRELNSRKASCKLVWRACPSVERLGRDATLLRPPDRVSALVRALAVRRPAAKGVFEPILFKTFYKISSN